MERLNSGSCRRLFEPQAVFLNPQTVFIEDSIWLLANRLTFVLDAERTEKRALKAAVGLSYNKT
jgi:hypothetical protein